MNGLKTFFTDIPSKITSLESEIKRARLNADIGRSVSELQSAMNQFELKLRLHKFLMRGKGLDFDGYREYTSTDDARTIDWKASMRSNQVLVKQYAEEKDLKVMFLVDVGDNMVFGSKAKLKCEYAAEVVGALSHVIIFSGNKSGHILFSDNVKRFVNTNKGERYFNLLVDDITNPQLYGGCSRMGRALNFCLNNLGERIDSLIIVSDFSTLSSELKTTLNYVSQRYETLCLVVKDPLDKTLPNVDMELTIQDPLSGEQISINPKYAKNQYEKIVTDKDKEIYSLFREVGIDFLELNTGEEFAFMLASFLKGRLRNI